MGRTTFTWAVSSDPGLRRSSNEDSYCTRSDLGLYVVADGMGGHVAGEVASRVAVEAIEIFIQETAGADKNRTWPFPFEPALSLEANRLKAAFRLANRRIASTIADSHDLRGMATTASSLLTGPDGACVAHVGDSRVYVLRGGNLQQITNDHSWVEEQVRAGTMTATAARQHPWRNVVTRALSGGEDPEVDVTQVQPVQSERYLLCSDGLFSVVRRRADRRTARHTRRLARRRLPEADRRRERGTVARTTSPRSCWRSMLRNLARLGRYRGLIQSLVARELKARYRGSILGFFWSFFNPLLLLLVYSIVFKYVMQAAHDPKVEPYALFMFCGILPWTWFASSLTESSGVLISGGNLIKKVLFPAEILPIVTVLSNMVHFFFGLVILAGFLIWYQRPLNLSELAVFPLAVAIQLILTTALALLLSSLTVHFRDIRDILSNLLTFWFFATPIIYPYFMFTGADGKIAWQGQLLKLNPFTHLAITYQEILFFNGPVGHLKLLLLLGAISVVFFFLCYWVFDRLRDTFAEEV